MVKRYGGNNFSIADPNRDGYITEEEWNRFRDRGVGEFGITAIHTKNKQILWRQKRGLPYVPSPLLYRGLLYTVRSGGFVTVFDVETGQMLKEGRWPQATGEYFASPVAADGRIYLANAAGRVSVLNADYNLEYLALTISKKAYQPPQP